MKAQRYLFLDYETRSEADLKVVGSYEYARHPSTEVLCLSFAVGTRNTLRFAPIYEWTPANSVKKCSPAKFLEFLRLLCDPKTVIVAHNALFEQVITRYVLVKYVLDILLREMLENLSPARWLCTAALAATLALPRKLEMACKAIKLPAQKDMEGHRLMLKMSKPRKPTKTNPAKWHCKIGDLKRLMLYCSRDLRAEIELFLALPPLSPTERAVWELDQRTNLRGFAVDRPLVKKILSMVETELARYDEELREISGGHVQSVNTVKTMREFLVKTGLKLPNLQAKTVRDTLKRDDLSPRARRVLEIRSKGAKSSTKKYYSIEARSRSDGRVRDLLMYHGASTGRWTGTGVQIQNFPRGTGRDSEVSADLIGKSDLELVRLLYGDPMDAFSFTLRSAIKATEGYEIFSGDYAAIEVRVLFWMAEHADGVAAYRDNRKIYEEMAQVVYDVRRLKDITKAQREIGKRIILGCGYGMGPPKFRATCEQYDVVIDMKLAKKSVAAYRSLHSPVQQFWWSVERAAIDAVQSPGKVFKTNKCRFWVENNFLWIELPSGRKLAYYGPKVRMEPTPWKELRPKLYHWGVHPKTKKWVFDSTYGARIVENIVQGTGRDVMAEASLRLDRANYPLLFSVHDELDNEKKIGRGNLGTYTRLMSIVPEWACGLPLKVETWKGPRYRK